MTLQTTEPSIDLNEACQRQVRSKILGVKMTPDEISFITSFAKGRGRNITTFTREALQAHIKHLLE
jgi:hypothetical protein